MNLDRLTILMILLLCLVLGSAAAVVSVRHLNRLAFVDLQEQEQRHDDLQAEWSRLMLERATWTRQNSVVDDARERLGMLAPLPERIVTLHLVNDGDGVR